MSKLRKGSHSFPGTKTRKKSRRKKRPALSAPVDDTGLPEFGNALRVLQTEYEPKIHIVEDLIVEGLTFLAGAAKLGKTTLLMQLMQVICNPKGGKVIGRKVNPGKALFISLEEDADDIHNRMQVQGWSKEEAANLTIIDFSQFMKNIGPLHTEGAVIELLDYMLRGEFLVVAVDSFTKAFLGLKNQNESAVVAAALTPIHEIVKKKHFAFVFIDHHGHARGLFDIRTRNAPDAIMNSSAKGQVADAAIGFYSEGRNKRSVTAVGRSVSDQEFKLKFDPIIQKSSRVKRKGDDTDDMTARQARITQCVRANYPIRLKGIADITGIASGNAQPIVKALVKAGVLLFDRDTKEYSPVGDEAEN